MNVSSIVRATRARDRLVGCGCVLFGAVLVVSAIAKLSQPHLAAASLSWTGLPLPLRLTAVRVGNVLEGAIGAALALLPDRRPARVAGGVLALVLLTLHLLGSAERCGCFGEVDVPHWASLATLVLGAASTMAPRRRAGGTNAAPLRAALTRLAVLLMTCGALMTRPGAATVAPTDALAAALGERGAAARCYVVVGSRGCEHCAAAMVELSRQGDEVWLVSRREADPGDAHDGTFDGLELSVAEELWWSLAGEKPPSLWRFVDGRLQALSADTLLAAR